MNGLEGPLTSMNFTVETRSVYGRKFPVKDDIVKVYGLRAEHLAEAGCGDHRISPTPLKLQRIKYPPGR